MVWAPKFQEPPIQYLFFWTFESTHIPSGKTNSLLLNMAIEIVSFHINSMVIFHSFLLTFTRGYHFEHRAIHRMQLLCIGPPYDRRPRKFPAVWRPC